MDNNLLCSWLGLPPGSWPPNHFVLLGLEPGTDDAAVIEASVHERMGILRKYQLTHPEPATEAMNRLAQAMICLTDESSRAAYLLEFFPHLSKQDPAPAAELVASPVDTPAEAQSPSSAQTAAPISEPATPAATLPAFPLPGGPDVVHMRRDLYFRIARTRQIRHLWARVGKHLNNPRRRLSRPAEATELIQHMQALPKLIQSFPTRLGQAGQPGYLVLALARQQLIVPTLQTLLPSQRLALARDWEAGQQVLLEQYKSLRSQSRTLRRRSPWDHLVRLTRSVLNNHPGLVVLSLSLLALNVAIPAMRQEWARQLAVILCLVVIRLVVWWAHSRPTELPIRERPTTAGRRRRSEQDQLSGRRANR